MGLQQELNLLGILAIGVRPQWVDVPASDFLVRPPNKDAGVFNEDSPLTYGYVACREDVSRREGRITVGVFDLFLGIYAITIQGQLVTYDTSAVPPATNADLIQDIIDTINAGPAALTDDVLAQVDPNDVAAVLLTGKDALDGADWSLSATLDQDGGTAEITVTAAAVGFDVTVSVTPGGVIRSSNTGNPDRWVEAGNGTIPNLGNQGWTERLEVAGYKRTHLHLFNVLKDAGDGATTTMTFAGVMLGPTVVSATT